MILDKIIQLGINLSLLSATAITCVVMIYLLFSMTSFISKMASEGDVKTVLKNTAGQPEVIQHIKVGKFDKLIHVRKAIIWKWIGIAYLVSFLIYLVPVVLIPVLFLFVLYKSLAIFVKLTHRSFQS